MDNRRSGSIAASAARGGSAYETGLKRFPRDRSPNSLTEAEGEPVLLEHEQRNATATPGGVLRRGDGRYAPRYSTRELVEIVAHAIRSVAPPGGYLTQALFNRSREALGYPDVEDAKQIASRLGTSWPDLVDKVATTTALDRLAFGDDARLGNQPSHDERHAFFTMRLVVRRLGRCPASPVELKAVIDEELAVAGRCGGRTLLDDLVPSLNQLLRLGNGFEGLCELVGFEPPRRRTRTEGIPIPIALSAYHRATGEWASYNVLMKVAAEQGFALKKRRPRNTAWSTFLDEAKSMEATGTNVPDLATLRDVSPRHPRMRWDDGKLVAAMVTYLDERDADPGAEPPGRIDYMARRQPDWPAASTFGRHGTFNEFLRKGRARQRSRIEAT